MKYTLGFSPCPNDTFIFDALVNHKIDTEGLDFDIFLEDVETLNQWALEEKLDFSKVSYGVLPLVLEKYLVLNSGGALGKGVGPLLIIKSAVGNEWTIANKSIAIPGENTTAHLLFSLAYPQAKNKLFKTFNEIEDAVLHETVDAGVIIHENRFTYHLKGLHKVVDLGEYWERSVNAPLPLGGIIAKRNLATTLTMKIDNLIKQSVLYAYQHHHKELSHYVQCHAQEMSEDVMRQHINLYVNNYSINLGDEGKKAINQLLNVYHQLHPEIKRSEKNIFIS